MAPSFVAVDFAPARARPVRPPEEGGKLWRSFLPRPAAGMSRPSPPLLVAADFAPDLLPATMEHEIAKSPGGASKGDPTSPPSLSQASPVVKMSSPVEGFAWRRPPPSHIPPPPARQTKPKSS